MSRLPLAVLVLLLTTAAFVRADAIDEALEYAYYDVDASAGTLGEALNAASPIRENGKTFHGYTKWHVNWRFWWRESRRGCTLNRVAVRVSGTITLPRLVDATPRNARQFEPYIASLKAHELGHYAFGQKAGADVDRYLNALPSMASCAELEREANAGARRILDRYIAEEKRYDIETRHGATQGAILR